MPRKANLPTTFAFIDSQNLNLGTQRMGWKLDWRKFRQFLADKYGVTQAYMFIGYMVDNESLYEYMHELGFLVVLKPTIDVSQSHDEKSTDGVAAKPKDHEENKEMKVVNLFIYWFFSTEIFF